MKIKNIKCIILGCLCLVFCIKMDAQSIKPAVLNTAGGSALISGNYWEYSIGEMAVVSTNIASTITVTHGVLQPFVKTPDAIYNAFTSSNIISVYPNPTNNKLHLSKINNTIAINKISLFDATGKVLYSELNPSFIGNHYTINLEAFTNGNYFLQILSNNYTNNTNFKITKSN